MKSHGRGRLRELSLLSSADRARLCPDHADLQFYQQFPLQLRISIVIPMATSQWYEDAKDIKTKTPTDPGDDYFVLRLAISEDPARRIRRLVFMIR